MNRGDIEKKPALFEELRADVSTPFDGLPDEVQTYVSFVDPKLCRKLIKELAYILPLLKSDGFSKNKALTEKNDYHRWPKLGHLRRVHRIQHPIEVVAAKPNEDNMVRNLDEETPKKRKKIISTMATQSTLNSVSLRILIGPVEQVDNILMDTSDGSKSAELRQLIRNYNLQLVREALPGRPAKSRVELNNWNAQNDGNGWWPSLFFEKQTPEFKEKELELDIDEEWGMMRNGMLAAVEDSRMFQEEGMLLEKGCDGKTDFCGAVVVCPLTRKVVSNAFDEWEAQASDCQDKEGDMKMRMKENPLSTPVLLAIQGVSRRERAEATGHGMDSALFMNGQYLCTGFDIYITKEPGIFEAMALVHSRIRRVIFHEDNPNDGGLGGTGSKTSVHCLPGTNHHYRVFRYCNRLNYDSQN